MRCLFVPVELYNKNIMSRGVYQDQPATYDEVAYNIQQAARNGRTDEIVDTLMSYYGEALTELKLAIDRESAETGLNLTRIVYEILSEKQGRRLIRRFASEACDQKIQKRRVLMTDVDDTIFPSKLGGTDTSLPNHVTYPGVRAFHMIMAPDTPTVVLTARPQSLAGSTVAKISKVLGGKPVTVLVGKAHELINATVATVRNMFGYEDTPLDYKGVAFTKLNNFERFQSVYPEMSIVFVGDSGQGDILTATKIHSAQIRLACKHNKTTFEAGFIHDVKRKGESTGRLDQKEREKLADGLVYAFDTYVGAAIHALARDFITVRQLELITRAAIMDMDAIESAHGEQPLYRELFDRDVAEAEALYVELRYTEPVMPSKQEYENDYGPEQDEY